MNGRVTSSPSSPTTEPMRPSVCRSAGPKVQRIVRAVLIASAEQ